MQQVAASLIMYIEKILKNVNSFLVLTKKLEKLRVVWLSYC